MQFKHANGYFMPVEMAVTSTRSAATGRVEGLLCGIRTLLPPSVTMHSVRVCVPQPVPVGPLPHINTHAYRVWRQ
jgi:hypothetical protein